MAKRGGSPQADARRTPLSRDRVHLEDPLPLAARDIKGHGLFKGRKIFFTVGTAHVYPGFAGLDVVGAINS